MFKKKAILNDIDLKIYGKAFRGVQTTKAHEKNTVLMYIPMSLIITPEMAAFNNIGK